MTRKYLRLAVQRLVMILPVEEQEDFPEVTPEEVLDADQATAEEREHADVVRHQSACVQVPYKKTSLVTEMLSSRRMFESMTRNRARTDVSARVCTTVTDQAQSRVGDIICASVCTVVADKTEKVLLWEDRSDEEFYIDSGTG